MTPAVDIWHEHAARYRALGYSTWVGTLNAADYGTPQTRRRAILMASRTRTVQPPEPTHTDDRTPRLFGELPPWRTMADALGGSPGDRTLTPGGTGYRDANRRTYELNEPAPTIAFGHDDARWFWTHPDGTRSRVTVEEALALQGFPEGYPLTGSRTARFLQVGNAIPPPLALAVLAAVTGRTTTTAEVSELASPR